jgi:hypothetical protein
MAMCSQLNRSEGEEVMEYSNSLRGTGKTHEKIGQDSLYHGEESRQELSEIDA